MKKREIGVIEIVLVLLMIGFVGFMVQDPSISNLGELKIEIQQQ
ncbi:MAG: hypothetical protein RR128_08435 [Clostridium sp.]